MAEGFSVSEDDDETLMERAKTDTAAFGLLLDRWLASVYRLMYRRMRDARTAERLTGDVFFRVISTIRTYKRSDVPFSAWLYELVNGAVDAEFLNRARRRRAVTIFAVVLFEALLLTTWTLFSLWKQPT